MRIRRPGTMVLVLLCSLGAARADTIRIGAAMNGTLAWEVAAMALQPDAPHRVEIKLFAGPSATKVALASGAVDLILADTVWTASMRAKGEDLVFAGSSRAVGALVVQAGLPLSDLSDLAGRRLGVAGGPRDKSWLLLSALAAKQGVHLENSKVVFGAPPLLDQQFMAGHLDALLTYWNHAADLEASGARRLLSVREIMRRLGLDPDLPILGFAISGRFAREHRAALNWFLSADYTAKQSLASCGPAWNEVVKTAGKSNQSMAALCAEYGRGIVDPRMPLDPGAFNDVLKVLEHATAPVRVAPSRVPDGLFLSDHAP